MLRRKRLPFVVLAMLSLVTGLLAGLQRIGWPLHLSAVTANHGAIMVGGFLGTLISLEKIIPLKRAVLYVIPFISGSSVLFFSIGFPSVSLNLLVIAAMGLTSVFAIYWVRERDIIYSLMFAGAACWLTGNFLLLATGVYPLAISWWIAFVLLTIAAERLELTKFLPVSRTTKLILVCALVAFVLGCLVSFHGAGRYVTSLSLVVVATWLMRYDVVGINLRKDGLPRFIAFALICGYSTLLLSGFLQPGVFGHAFGYDILVHCFFIGFVFSMIFAHGPIILPGVLGISVKPFHPILYVWLVILHSSWILRLTGDLMLIADIRRYSGIISATAIVGYFITLATITIRAYRAEPV